MLNLKKIAASTSSLAAAGLQQAQSIAALTRRTAIARARAFEHVIKLAKMATGSASPLRQPLDDAAQAVSDSVEVLRAGKIGPDDLARLERAARSAEAAMNTIQMLSLVPGPIGVAGRVAALLRKPLGTWAAYIARSVDTPDTPAPVEMLALPAAAPPAKTA